jgi:hypothetical protein
LGDNCSTFGAAAVGAGGLGSELPLDGFQATFKAFKKLSGGLLNHTVTAFSSNNLIGYGVKRPRLTGS